jgi:integrase
MDTMEITKIAGRKSPWKVEIPRTMTGGRKVRRFFRTKPDAIAFISKVRREGFASTEPESTTITVREGVEMWVARSHDKSPAYQRQLRLITGHLCDFVGARSLPSITHQQLEEWLLSLPGGQTYRINHYRVARRFFEWCMDWLEVIPRNPMKKVGRPAAAEGQERHTLTPGEMQQVLALSKGRLRSWVALGGFAGLRSEEILRLDWGDVNLKAKEIFVRNPKQSQGWRPRYVQVLPALIRALGEVPVSGKVFPGGMRELYMQRHAVVLALGWARWPQNCLRHSFGTYHLAQWKDAARTAHEMGHTNSEITHRHYAIAARSADAAAWWKLGA